MASKKEKNMNEFAFTFKYILRSRDVYISTFNAFTLVEKNHRKVNDACLSLFKKTIEHFTFFSLNFFGHCSRTVVTNPYNISTVHKIQTKICSKNKIHFFRI